MTTSACYEKVACTHSILSPQDIPNIVTVKSVKTPKLFLTQVLTPCGVTTGGL